MMSQGLSHRPANGVMQSWQAQRHPVPAPAGWTGEQVSHQATCHLRDTTAKKKLSPQSPTTSNILMQRSGRFQFWKAHEQCHWISLGRDLEKARCHHDGQPFKSQGKLMGLGQMAQLGHSHSPQTAPLSALWWRWTRAALGLSGCLSHGSLGQVSVWD